MTIVMFIVPLMGMPKLDAAAMLSMMFGFPSVVGWIMHFIIGIIFAGAYVLFFRKWLKRVRGIILKGVIFGIAVFVFAQIMLALLGTMFPMPSMEGSMVLMMTASILGHVVFGIVVAWLAKEQVPVTILA
jgi:uncharacterized membrane protein YagU involved in acid resistance